jgi:hypothetical protein
MMASSELREAYRTLQAEHVAMRAKLDDAVRTFKREFKQCRPSDEATLAAKFRAILEALRASVAAAGPIAAEKLRGLDE